MSGEFPKRICVVFGDATETAKKDGGEAYIREKFWSDAMAKLEKSRTALEASAAMASRQNALIDTLRDELAKEKAKSARLVDAAVYLRDDMLVRAECGIDIIHGEQYRVVNAGNGAWVGFIDAIATYEVKT